MGRLENLFLSMGFHGLENRFVLFFELDDKLVEEKGQQSCCISCYLNRVCVDLCCSALI